jgi:hypothetical protein
MEITVAELAEKSLDPSKNHNDQDVRVLLS